MESILSEVVGHVAAALTTFALLPQVIKTYKTKSALDISWGWIISLTLGTLMWLIYGLMIYARPVILANGVTFFLSLLVMFMKRRYTKTG